MGSQPLSIDTASRVATVTIDRPAQKNAFSLDMWHGLADACRDIEAADDVRVAVIIGRGGSFSVGGDFDDFAGLTTKAERSDYLEVILTAYAAWEALAMPTVAAVDGWALGGGCELAMISDIVVATESSRFGLPEGRVGMYPGVAVSRAFEHISPRFLDYLIYTGHIASAAEARDGGIVSVVVEDGTLDEAVAGVASKVAASAPLAMRAAKRAAIDARSTDGYSRAAADIPQLMTTADHAEGLAAFVARRAPEFKGR